MADPVVLSGSALPFTAPAGGVTAGIPAIIGEYFVLPATDAAVSVRFAGDLEGVWQLDKLAGEAYTEGQALYWDSVAGNLTTTRRTAIVENAYAGLCADFGGVASGATTARVRVVAPAGGGAGVRPAIVLIADTTPGSVATVTVKAINAAGGDHEEVTPFRYWISSSATTGAIHGTAPDGNATWTPTKLGDITADLIGESVTDASGDASVVITHAGGAVNYYLYLEIAGNVAISAIIAIS